jgi:hypothetical protein
LTRRLLNLLSVLSLLVCVAVCVLWVRSALGRSDTLYATKAASWSWYSGEGVICGEEIFVLKGDASGGGIAACSDHWTARGITG